MNTMIIRRLNLKYFGKFNDFALDLEPGLNIIHGDNEAGKTTIHNFIESMLFGIERKRGRAARNDDYNRNLPWDYPHAFEGTMDFDFSGESYRIDRSFLNKGTNHKIIDLNTGREVSLKSGNIEDVILGFSKSIFNNTISIGQLNARTDDSLRVDLTNYITNMEMARDEEIDVEKALDLLKDDQRKLSKTNTQELINKTEEEIQEINVLEIEMNHLAERLGRVGKEQAILSQDKRRFYKEKEDLAYDKIKDYPLIAVKYEEHQELILQEKSLRNQLENQYDETKRHESGYGKERQIILSLLPALAGTIIGLGSFGVGIEGILFALLGIIIGGIIYVDFHKRRKNTLDQLIGEGKQLWDDQEKIKERSELIQDEITEYMRLFIDINNPSEGDMDDLAARVEAIKQMIDDKEESLKSQIKDGELKIKKLEWEIEKAQESENLLLKNGDKDQLLDKLNELQHKRIQEDINKEAITLAEDTIKFLSNEIQGSFGPALNAGVSRIMSNITDDKYNKVMISDELEGQLKWKDSFVDIEKVSAGTLDQIYLSLRLTVADLLFEDKDMPIILDDSFVLYDDTRAEQALKEISKRSQVILFTCQNREKEVLERLHIPHHYIDLNIRN